MKNLRGFILWTGRKSVTVSDYAPKVERGDVVKVFCGVCTVARVIDRNDGNKTIILN